MCGCTPPPTGTRHATLESSCPALDGQFVVLNQISETSWAGAPAACPILGILFYCDAGQWKVSMTPAECFAGNAMDASGECSPFEFTAGPYTFKAAQPGCGFCCSLTDETITVTVTE
jgi:hypothetical protein